MSTERALTRLLEGGRYYEAPRWKDGKLWFVDTMARTLLSVGLSGKCETHATFNDTPCNTGILPDARLIVLTMFRKQLLAYHDGKVSP
jgi:hypothetical protein